MDAIDKFNQALKASTSPYFLDDTKAKIDDNYSVYLAKKKGIPKDDFPGKSSSSLTLLQACP